MIFHPAHNFLYLQRSLDFPLIKNYDYVELALSTRWLLFMKREFLFGERRKISLEVEKIYETKRTYVGVGWARMKRRFKIAGLS